MHRSRNPERRSHSPVPLKTTWTLLSHVTTMKLHILHQSLVFFTPPVLISNAWSKNNILSSNTALSQVQTAMALTFNFQLLNSSPEVLFVHPSPPPPPPLPPSPFHMFFCIFSAVLISSFSSFLLFSIQAFRFLCWLCLWPAARSSTHCHILRLHAFPH